MNGSKTDPELLELLKKAKEWWENSTPEEKEVLIKKQREGYVRAEMSWPQPKFKMAGNVKVYDSMEDYYND
jgi:hypothetical protein